MSFAETSSSPICKGPVVVIGAGGLGEEVRDCISAAGRVFAGFLDDGGASGAIGPVDPCSVPDDAFAIIAIGDPETRLRIVQRFRAFDRWAIVVHPTAVVSPRSHIGRGTFVGPLAYVGPLADVGAHVVINVHAEVGHHAVVRDFATLSPLAALNGGVILGEGAFLGTAATIEPRLRIGAWSRISAASHASATCGEGTLLHGNPARGRQMFRPPSPVEPRSGSN
jgi:sugar O-acyltransferase (sialic acid O-acetyltransferase NeuD family)